MFLLFACDLLAHWSVTHNPAYSLWSVGLALAFGGVALILDVDALIGRWRRDGRNGGAFIEDLAA